MTNTIPKTTLLLATSIFYSTACGDTKNSDTSDDSVSNSSAWTEYAHPCVGNRTDAMWFDDANNGFVGCGSTTDGYGLYKTTDAGQTWSNVTSVNNILDSMRVNSIQRASNGNLYLGGTGEQNVRIVYLDTSNNLQEYYLKPATGAQSWQTYQVGTFRLDSNNRGVSESLTGSDVMYWSTGNAEAVSGYGWWNEAGVSGGAQILDMEIHNNRFYAVGSTINQPPYFYYEDSAGMGDTFSMKAIKLSGDGLSDFDGEVWDIAIDSNGDMLLAGVNQGTDVGVLWHNIGDVTSKDNWRQYDITAIVPVESQNATRFYGACRNGDLMVAVGDYSQQGDGIVVYSTNGGTDWNFLSPTTSPLSKCQIFGQNVYVTGADGLFAVLDVTKL